MTAGPPPVTPHEVPLTPAVAGTAERVGAGADLAAISARANLLADSIASAIKTSETKTSETKAGEPTTATLPGDTTGVTSSGLAKGVAPSGLVNPGEIEGTENDSHAATSSAQIAPDPFAPDPCPRVLPDQAGQAAHEQSSQPPESAAQDAISQPSVTEIATMAERSQQLAQDAAQHRAERSPPAEKLPRADVTLEEVTVVDDSKARAANVTARRADGVAAAGAVAATVSPLGRIASTPEQAPTAVASSPLVSVEFRHLLAKDFVKPPRGLESLDVAFSTREWKEHSRLMASVTALHSDQTAVTAHRRVEERVAPSQADSDHVGSQPNRDLASPVSLSAVPSPTAAPFKFTADTDATVAEQLATAVLNQLDAEPLTARTFRMRLDPRELGPVEVQLTVVNDVVSIRFVANDEAARQVITRQLDDLRQSFTNSGISFGQFDVGSNGGGGQRSPQTRDDHPPFGTSARRGVPADWSSRFQTHDASDERYAGRLNFVA